MAEIISFEENKRRHNESNNFRYIGETRREYYLREDGQEIMICSGETAEVQEFLHPGKDLTKLSKDNLFGVLDSIIDASESEINSMVDGVLLAPERDA